MIKIVSWNIWQGKYLDRVIEVLAQQNADVIGLQEVRQEISGSKTNIAKLIAKKLSYELVYCKSFTTDRHQPSFDLGNAILTRIPITGHSCHVLSNLDLYVNSSVTEPRSAVEVQVESKYRKISLIATHLGYSENFLPTEIRDLQVNNLLKIAKNKECIIMGDFNSLPNSELVQKLNKLFNNTDPVQVDFSWTNFKKEDKPEYRIDYIYVSQGISFSDFRIVKTDASDHALLSVMIDI